MKTALAMKSIHKCLPLCKQMTFPLSRFKHALTKIFLARFSYAPAKADPLWLVVHQRGHDLILKLTDAPLHLYSFCSPEQYFESSKHHQNPPSSDGGFFLISVIGKTELTESGMIIILLLRYIDQIETAFLLNEGDEGNWQSFSNACAGFWRNPQ